MLDWLIVSAVYLLPMLAVAIWLTVAVPRLMASHRPPPTPDRDEKAESSLNDKFRRFGYFAEKQSRDQELIENLIGVAKKHTADELQSAAKLADEIKALPERAQRGQREERELVP